MNDMNEMNERNDLIVAYVSDRDVYTVEKALDALVGRTTPENFIEISESMRSSADFQEMDLVLYLEELTDIHASDLTDYIEALIRIFEDPKAIEELEAIQKE